MIHSFFSVLLPLFAVAGFAWLFVRRFEVSPYVAPLCALGSIVTCLYLSDFLSLMRIAAIVLLVCGNLAFARYSIEQFRSGQPVSTRHLVLLSILLSGLLSLYSLNMQTAFTNWDEFSHWGTFAKLVASEHTFHLKQKLIRYYFEDYPPGTALLSYFFLQGTGYSESIIYFSYSLILVAGCLPTIGLAMAGSYVRGFVAIIACYLLVIVLGQGWSSALIDQVVGILFGGVICGYWLLRDAPSRRFLVLVPVLCFLVLSKQSGASFCLLATGLIAVDRLCVMRSEKTLVSKGMVLLPVLPIWLVPRLIQSSWTWHVNNQGLTKTFSAANLGESFGKFAKCCYTDRELATTANFFHVTMGTPAIEPSTPGSFLHVAIEQIFRSDVLRSLWHASMSTPGKLFIFLCILLVVSLFVCKPALRGRLALFNAALMAACAAYVLTLLVYYLYVFSEYEGRALASYARFLNTYYLAAALFAVGVLLSRSDVAPIRENTFRIFGIALLFHISAFSIPFAKAYLIDGGTPISLMRTKIQNFVRPVVSFAPKNSSVYALWESASIRENGFEFWMMHYELRPRNTNLFCFSLGPPQYEGDIWSCKMNEQEVRNAFAGYQYVAVGSGVRTLKALYPEIFALATGTDNSGIFEVFKDSNGKLALRPFQPGLSLK